MVGGQPDGIGDQVGDELAILRRRQPLDDVGDQLAVLDLRLSHVPHATAPRRTTPGIVTPTLRVATQA